MGRDDIKRTTAVHFMGPFATWVDEITQSGADRQMAFIALLHFFAHQLAGVAVEFDIQPDFAEAGEIVEELSAEQYKNIRIEMLPF